MMKALHMYAGFASSGYVSRDGHLSSSGLSVTQGLELFDGRMEW